MDHTDVGLRAAIRALSDVVAPAVDTSHAQARDQLRLTVDYLAFVVERLPYLHERDRFELTHHLSMARDLAADLGPTAPPRLRAAIDAGAVMLERSGSGTLEVRAATAELTGAISDVLHVSNDMSEPIRDSIERHVLQASKQRIAFERAWYQPLGLDPDPHDVRPLSELLPASH